MQPSELELLLQKFLDDTITAEELHTFRQYVLEEKEAAAQEAAIEAILRKDELPGELPGNKEEVFSQLMAEARRREVTVIRPVRRWWAAAAAVLLLGTGTYFVVRNFREQPSLAVDQSKSQEVRPGREGAILTLADGSQVVLDSMKNGVVTTQGGSKLLLQKGQLSYEGHTTGEAQLSYNTITTPRGRQFQVVLPDGTKIWLNAASRLLYPVTFSGTERKVEISGEAYLEVAANATQPFIVKTDKGEIEVLGTSFNVNAYTDEAVIRTTLLQGKVRVKAGAHSSVLSPGQQATIGEGITVTDNANTVQAVAWKNGIFDFQNASLEAVMRQLSRWYDVEVIYEKQVPAITFGGEMGRNLELKDVLEFLEGSGVHFRVEGRKLIVMP